MRRLITAFAFLIVPFVTATAEDEATTSESAKLDLPAVLPEQMTPETLSAIANKLERLSKIRLVRESGGRSTAEERRAVSFKTLLLASELEEAAMTLKQAQDGKANFTAQLATAEADAVAVSHKIASEVGDLDIAQELFDLLEGPPAKEPDPVTHVFCMEASGPGPRTFARFVPEALTQAIPYVQGYITHEIEQTAPKKIRLTLTVKHDAGAAPFGALDALHNSNKRAFEEMSDEIKARTVPAETILMGELAEQLCSPTPPRGQ